MKKGTVAVLSTLLGTAVGAVAGVTVSTMLPQKQQSIDKVFKFKSYYNMLNQWLKLKAEGKSLDQYFTEKGYRSIAIYGMGEMGERLIEELKNSKVEVKYGIDKNADCIYNDLPVYELSDELEAVDAVVVTAIFAFEEISENLESELSFPIISLEDVVFEI